MEEIRTEESSEALPKPSFRARLVWIGVFGFLLGMVLKTEAVKRITIGFEDYKMAGSEQRYDINRIQAELKAKEEAAKQATEESSAGAVQPEGRTGNPEGGSCDSASDTCQAGQ